MASNEEHDQQGNYEQERNLRGRRTTYGPNPPFYQYSTHLFVVIESES